MTKNFFKIFFHALWKTLTLHFKPAHQICSMEYSDKDKIYWCSCQEDKEQ